MKHLCIQRNPWYKQTKEGIKKIESRWFVKRSMPYRKVNIGDIIYFKLAGSAKVECWAECINVRYIMGKILAQQRMREFKDLICVDEKYIDENKYRPYLCLFWLGPIHILEKPYFHHQPGRQAWIYNFDPNPQVPVF